MSSPTHLRSFQARIILSFILIVVLTAVAVGLLLLWVLQSFRQPSGVVGDFSALQTRLIVYWLVGVLVAAALGALLGLILARRIRRPLSRLADAAEQIGQGDLGTPVSVATDLSELAQASRALENARLELARTVQQLKGEKAWADQLLESIVEGIMTLDAQGRITFFSHGAERITGWSREEVLNRPSDEIFKVVGEEAAFSQSLPAPGQRNRILVKLASGKEAILSFTRAQLTPPGAKGEGGVVLVFRDVSETVAIHRILGYFIANVAHEFRTPLSALAASIELLMDQAGDLEPEEMDELLKSLHLGVISLQTLVDNLLESASIEAGHFQVTPRAYDLDVIINDAVSIMQPLLDKYNQRLVMEVADGLPLVSADPRRVIQVLVNLLSNASKYGPAEAEILLRAIAQGSWVRVEVADRGPGIPSQDRELLFRRFEYPTSMMDDQSKKVGAGLGLSVVKAVIEAHGGRTEVEDRPGGGSIFWFTLPAASER